jgi:hypothetical protein
MVVDPVTTVKDSASAAPEEATLKAIMAKSPSAAVMKRFSRMRMILQL